jgi:hypothetical protein
LSGAACNGDVGLAILGKAVIAEAFDGGRAKGLDVLERFAIRDGKRQTAACAGGNVRDLLFLRKASIPDVARYVRPVVLEIEALNLREGEFSRGTTGFTRLWGKAIRGWDGRGPLGDRNCTMISRRGAKPSERIERIKHAVMAATGIIRVFSEFKLQFSVPRKRDLRSRTCLEIQIVSKRLH